MGRVTRKSIQCLYDVILIVSGCADVYYQGYRDKDMMMVQPHRNISAFKVECRLHEGPVTRILKREQGETDFFEEAMNFYHYK